MGVPPNMVSRFSNPLVGLEWWIELEGIPNAFGNVAKDASFFAARDAGQKFERVLPWASTSDSLDIAEQVIDFIGGRSSMAVLEYAIADMDGSLRELTTIRREDMRVTLRDAIDDSTASIEMDGSMLDWPASGVAYIGREAVTFTRSGSTLNISQRGAYRTRAVAHNVGALVTPYPRFAETRRAWVYWGATPKSATDAHALFPGFIESTSWQQRGRVLHLSIADQQLRMRQRLFRTIGKGVWNEDKTNEPRIEGLSSDTVRGWINTFRGTSYDRLFLLRDRPENATWPKQEEGFEDTPRFLMAGDELV